MNEIKNLMPEWLCTIDDTMSLEKIIRAKDSKLPIVGRVILWNKEKKNFLVDLGNDFYGFIPVDDSSLYPPLYSSGKITPSLFATIGKPIVAVVKSINSDGKIILSRKESMLDAFNTISTLVGKKIECCITAFSPFGIFVDVGKGVCGLINRRSASTSRLRSFSDMGLKIGDKITAKVISFDENFHIELNYKDQFEYLGLTLAVNDSVDVMILDRLNSNGFFAYVNPNTTAIINIPYGISCKYGDKGVAKVRNSSVKHPDKLRLEFVSF